MGFGGEVTLLGCKIGVMNRLPASFFVSVAYNCWAYRRQGVLLDSASGEIKEWVYERGSSFRWTAPRKVKRQELPKKRQKLPKQLL